MPTPEQIDALRGAPVSVPSMIVGGKRHSASASMPVFSPVDGSALTDLPLAQQADVDTAVAAARQSFDAGIWAGMAPKARKKVLLNWAYGGADNTVPPGGFKQSGNGHDKSLHGIDKYINHKTAWLTL